MMESTKEYRKDRSCKLALANGRARSIILTDVISARFPDSLVGRLPENAATDCGHRVK